MSKTSSADGDEKLTAINDLLSLPDNWDSEGASMFSAPTANTVTVNDRTHKIYGAWNISRVSKKFVRNVLSESKAFLDGGVV